MRETKRFGQNVGSMVTREAHILHFFALFNVYDELIVALSFQIGHNAAKLAIRKLQLQQIKHKNVKLSGA